MGKVKPRAVFTPGSQPTNSSPGSARGRPKKAKEKATRMRAPRLKYPKNAMLSAINAVKNKQMSYGEAAKHYGVPKTTIYERVHFSSGKLGRKPELTDEEEEIIVERSEVGKVR